MNILIADDDPTSRIVLGAGLKKLGHQVTAVTGGAEALAVWRWPQYSVDDRHQCIGLRVVAALLEQPSGQRFYCVTGNR